MNAESEGASVEAIQAHYDIGDSFYRLWLDRTMTYSCALWRDGDTLEEAQLRKLDFHVAGAGAVGARRVLDVGCGWGSLLTRLVEVHKVGRAVGLTLSETQMQHISELRDPRIEGRLEGWQDHQPSEAYDAIISIGAFEHFVQPTLSTEERVAVYRRFFLRAKEMLRKGGALSIQTSAYGLGKFTGGAIASIFPESDLPRLSEIAAAAEGNFEIVELRNDREDYARTCQAWLENLTRARFEARREVGNEVVQRYERFLDAAVRGFRAQVFHLLRMSFRRVDLPS
jgi:cyclopropane-fatty-acyl-phospholipid synthase